MNDYGKGFSSMGWRGRRDAGRDCEMCGGMIRYMSMLVVQMNWFMILLGYEKGHEKNPPRSVNHPSINPNPLGL